MRTLAAAVMMLLIATACSGPPKPNDKDALIGLRQVTFKGESEAFNNVALLDAHIIECKMGKRGAQSMASCEVCLRYAVNERAIGAFAQTESGISNSLFGQAAVVRAGFTRALSFDQPDVVPDNGANGVWLASPTLSVSPVYKVDYKDDPGLNIGQHGHRFSKELVDLLKFPTDRKFEKSPFDESKTEYDDVIVTLETDGTDAALQEMRECRWVER